MQQLIGREFQIDQRDFLIVDSRQLGSQLMIYAQPLVGEESIPDNGPLRRRAFHYADIAPYLERPTVHVSLD